MNCIYIYLYSYVQYIYRYFNKNIKSTCVRYYDCPGEYNSTNKMSRNKGIKAQQILHDRQVKIT